MNDNLALIVDDDIWMQRILSKTLEVYGFKTILASNGFEGIALAVEHQPKLIILDILMPELSGHLTLRILKNIKTTKHIPVLMVSAMSDTENLGLAVKSGTAGFISKPFTRATVFEKLINIFGREGLELISKSRLPEEVQVQYQASFANEPNIPSRSATAETLPPIPLSETSKTPLASEQILQTYKTEEKNSIDSIKKLLLKINK